MKKKRTSTTALWVRFWLEWHLFIFFAERWIRNRVWCPLHMYCWQLVFPDLSIIIPCTIWQIQKHTRNCWDTAEHNRTVGSLHLQRMGKTCWLLSLTFGFFSHLLSNDVWWNVICRAVVICMLVTICRTSWFEKTVFRTFELLLFLWKGCCKFSKFVDLFVHVLFLANQVMFVSIVSVV